ncbi:MAG: GTP-binding protein [Candidatus Aenigmarchaeota archaeon]|nr:GTP-binding protein [Candidatus Aenigmarchaeota archaeon]
MVPVSNERISIPRKENKNIEFKERLTPAVHLKDDKRQHLAAQMRYTLELGRGEAVYIIGVDDNGKAVGLTDIEFEETLNVLKVVATENGARLVKTEKFSENGDGTSGGVGGKFIGRLLFVRDGKPVKQHVIVATAGHVNHGKSTLIACLMTGRPDSEGKSWLYLDTLPHEIEHGLSADLHFALYGFKTGKPLHFKNPLDKRERAKVVAEADKLVSFVDTVGHENWQKTTIRGLVGQNIDYGLLVVAADDGVTHITREHLGLLLAMDLPVIICVTKVDRAQEAKIAIVERQIDDLLKNVGRVPYAIRKEGDIAVIVDKMQTVVPVIRTSAATLEGYDLLDSLLLTLPERAKPLDRPFLMFIDRSYNITGAGVVVSGTIKQGVLTPDAQLIIGPDKEGRFSEVKAKSIEMHYHRLELANAGLVVGVALKGIRFEDVERGMILCDASIKPRAVRSVEAEVLVLNHPTRIATGYEPVLHTNTVAESVKLSLVDKRYLKAGESGQVCMTFRYKPQFLQEGDKFVFREGKTKGIGTITKIVAYA